MKISPGGVSIILLVAGSLATGILTGWFRLGFDLPVSNIFLHHGAIMTGSFLGSVILIERVVTLKRKWLFAFPIINASSILFYYLDFQKGAMVCLIVGALGLFYVFYRINRDHPNLPHQVMWVGSTTWLIGNVLLFLHEMYAYAILWWMAFLLLTISGERLELTRFLPVSDFKKKMLIFFLGLFVVSCLLPFHMGGQFATGIGLLLASLWLLRYDMIRKSMKMSGAHRYTAITLLCGYVWLAVSGILYLTDFTRAIPYDSLMHSFFLGFVFSMIFAHAPIILPGVLGISVSPFHRSLYVWVMLFEVSLLARVGGGLMEMAGLVRWGGMANGVIVVLFLINVMGVTVSRARYRQRDI